MPQAPKHTAADSPFNLGNTEAYEIWRARKLAAQPIDTGIMIIDIADAAQLTMAEKNALTIACKQTNFAVYRHRPGPLRDKEQVRRFGAQLGLQHLDNNLCADDDAITPLTVTASGRRQEYIPYTNRPLSWHTDGYYNPSDRQVLSWSLHCVRSAASGGENRLMDHEMAYLLLRDEDPALIAALHAQDALTIPANIEQGVEIRGARTGPVFSIDTATGCLHMRYSARTRNIIWKDTEVTRRAVDRLRDIMNDDSPYVYMLRLEPGMGVFSNNILHNRSGFDDDNGEENQRLIYRARYYDRIGNCH